MDDTNHIVTFLINGAVVATSTTHYPTNNTALRWVQGIQGINGKNNAAVICWFYGECDT